MPFNLFSAELVGFPGAGYLSMTSTGIQTLEVLHISQMKRKEKNDQRKEQWEATLQLAEQSFVDLSKMICQILVAPVLPRHVGQANTLPLQEKQEKKKYIKTLSDKNKLPWVCRGS